MAPTPTPTTPPAPTGTIPPLVGFVLAVALAAVSTAVHCAPDTPVVGLAASRAAVARTGGGAPVILVNGRHEEVVWYAGGEVRLKAPWEAVEEPSWVALAHDAAALPGGGLEEVGQVMVEPPWAARRMGVARAGRDVFGLLERAEVSVLDTATGTRRSCSTWQTGQWFCGPNPWNFVGPNELVIDGERRRCLWLHPHEQGSLEVRFMGLKAGWRFVGRLALSDEAAATPGGSPVEVKVEVDGAVAVRHRQPNVRGWRELNVELPGVRKGETAVTRSMTLTVTAPRTGRRHLCMVGTLVPGDEGDAP